MTVRYAGQEGTVPQVGHLWELYRDARSPEYKKLIWQHFLSTNTADLN